MNIERSENIIAITPESRSRAKNKINLTDTFITKIKAPKRVARGTKKVKLPKPRYWDSQVEGLFIRVTHTGHKSWKLVYRNERDELQEYHIGTFPRFRTGAARKKAKQELARVQLGEDIQYKKKQMRESQGMELFSKQYLEKRCSHLQSYPNLQTLFNGHIVPYFKKTKVSTITKALVEDFHMSKKDTPYVANRCKAALHKLFKYAIELDLMEHNPAHGIKNFIEHAREGWFANESLEMLKDALSLHYKKYPLHTNFFRLLLNTGRRPSEIYTLRWSDIDFAEKRMTINTKTGLKTFPLSDLTITNLEDCRRYSGNYIYIFSKMAMNVIIKKSEAPIDTYWKTYKWHWTRIKARMPGVDLTVYHLRHSFGSHMLKANKNLYNVKEAMGHSSIKTTERYMKVLDEDVRKEINNTEALNI